MEIPKAVNNYNTFIFIHSINKLHLNLSVQIYDFISDAHDFLYQNRCQWTLTFSSFTKSREVSKRHGFLSELTGYIGRIHQPVFYYSQLQFINNLEELCYQEI